MNEIILGQPVVTEMGFGAIVKKFTDLEKIKKKTHCDVEVKLFNGKKVWCLLYDLKLVEVRYCDEREKDVEFSIIEIDRMMKLICEARLQTEEECAIDVSLCHKFLKLKNVRS